MRGQTWSLAAATVSGDLVLGRRGGSRRLLGGGLLLLALALALGLALAGGAFERGASSAPAAALSDREILDRLTAAPVGFVENAGQAHDSVTHLAQGPGYAFAFGSEGVRVSLSPSLSLGLEFVGTGRGAEAELAGQPSGRADYLVGERSRWQTGLAAYPELVYRELWPGIDMAFSGSGGKLKYEFRVAPGADPSRIQLAYQGAQSLSLGSAGALQVHSGQGVLKDTAPVSYQHIDGRRVPVESSYALGQGTGYGFAVGAYDQAKPLVIDPGLEYSTYLGGGAFDTGLGIARNGNDAFIVGGTPSPDFPVTEDAYQPTKAGPPPPSQLAQDAFLSRIDTTKSGAASLEYSTFLGGSGPDAGFSVAVVGSDAFVTGATFSPDFPTTAKAYDKTFNGPQGGSDGYVTRIDTNRAGSAGLEYSTYLGGAANDRGLGIDVVGAQATLTGIAESPDFPVRGFAYDTTQNGGEDAFVTRIDTSRSGPSGLRYSTFLGGTANDSGRGITVKDNRAYLTGPTQSADFPVTGNAFDSTDNPGEDGFVAKVDTGRKRGASLRYSTYLGGTGDDSGRGIGIKDTDAFVTGVTTSSDFPVTRTAFDETHNGDPGTIDAFVTRLDTTTAGPSGLEYSTYLGGSGPEDFGGTAGGIAVQGNDAFVTGATFSPDFPTTANAFDTTFNGSPGTTDAFLSRIDTLRSRAASLEYSTFLGGSNIDLGRGVAPKGDDAFIGGATASADFPVTPSAFDTTLNDPGFGDAFVTRLDTTP
jgi:hypothetical protein